MSETNVEKELLNVPWREKWRAYKNFLRIIWRANPSLAAFRFAMLFFGAFLQPIEVYAFSLFISAIATGKSERAPSLIAIVAITYGLRVLINNITYSKIDGWFSRNAGLATQLHIFGHISRLDPEQLLKEDVRRDLDFVREDLWRLNNLPNHTEWFVRSCFKIVGAIGLAFAAPFWVTLVVLFHAVLEAVILGYESKKDIWISTWNSLDGRRVEYARYIFLSGDDFREIRLLGAAHRFIRNMRESCVRIIARFRTAALQSFGNRVFLSFVHAGAYAIVIVVLGSRAFSGPEALATLYVSVNLFGLMGEALGGLSSSVSRISADLGILTRVNHLLELPVESEKGIAIPKGPMIVEFKNVSYRYPGTEAHALKNISLTFREGEHIAIVGENGAGKSTFLRLLSGLDRPTSGEILLNGASLGSYKRSEWRRAFHLMLQGAKLYQDFLRENLLYGAPQTKWKKIAFPLEQSVHIAGAESVIREVPSGYETFLGDWAAPPDVIPHRVSGGQQQKLLIARTLVHGGRIVGFDEPTSAMDALAESGFFERLHESMAGRGLIFISHRFSTVRRANRILVFHEGRMSEEGTHDELVALGGKYSKLYAEQAKWYA
ncbi:MAG: ABC transporter ATP-binding protein [Patescibacteria group bacterium]